MPTFRYQGRKQDGSKIAGKVEAASQELAVDNLMNKGITPIEMLEGVDRPEQSLDLKLLFLSTLPLEVLVIFCRQLYSLTKAGVPLLRAMRGLTQNCSNKLLKQALDDVSTELSGGRSLSDAMQMHPRVFSSLFVSMIHVGENTGRLDEALHQLALYYEQESETRKRIKTAMRYPVLVIVFMVFAMFILNIFVIPQFLTLFNRLGADLPLPTIVLIATSEFFVNHWKAMLVAMVMALLGFRVWRNTVNGRHRWDFIRLRIPIVGGIVNRAQLSRFSRTFALMQRAGVPLNQSLALAAEALGNKYLESRLLEMKSSIESGITISSAAISSQVFTSLVIQMIAVGEETGRIDELLLEAADFYDREVDYDLKTLTARMEPILLLIVASMVLVLALGIFLPMWNMMDVIQR